MGAALTRTNPQDYSLPAGGVIPIHFQIKCMQNISIGNQCRTLLSQDFQDALNLWLQDERFNQNPVTAIISQAYDKVDHTHVHALVCADMVFTISLPVADYREVADLIFHVFKQYSTVLVPVSYRIIPLP